MLYKYISKEMYFLLFNIFTCELLNSGDNMIDISVFKSLLKRDIYEKYKHVIFQIPNLEFEIKKILHSIRDYYSTYPEKEELTVDELRLHFNNNNPSIKNPETFIKLIARLYDADINNTALLITSINKLSEVATANAIMQDCIEICNNYRPDSLQKIQKHLEFYDKLTASVNASESDVCNLSLDELLRLDSTESGINWELEFLQKTIGPLKPGTLAHIFAYSETGKTSLGIFELAHYASKSVDPDCVLYLGNEEPVSRTKLRAFCALLNSDMNRIRKQKDSAEKRWNELVGNRIKFIDDVRHISKVEQYINDFKPSLVMIDQGPKVEIPGDYNEVKKLQQLYNRYRQLAVNNNTRIITLGQAESSCANKKRLNLNNMDMSKVGIPGELDVAIGIGRTDEEGFESVRYLSVCKNKLTGFLGSGQVSFDNQKCYFQNRR